MIFQRNFDIPLFEFEDFPVKTKDELFIIHEVFGKVSMTTGTLLSNDNCDSSIIFLSSIVE